MLADYLGMVCGALNKRIFRILLHQVQLVRISTGALFNGLANVPQPCRIHMAMTNNTHAGSCGTVVASQCRSHNLLAFFQRCIKLFLTDAGRVIIEHLMQLKHHIDQFCFPIAGIIQYFYQLAESPQVKIEISDFFIFYADIHL